MKVENAIILAAGTGSRFMPLSYEKHKALVIAKGEVLIERQIQQLIDAGIKEIHVVTGFLASQFEYLRPKYDVNLIYNQEYESRNNSSSIWAARQFVRNSYICSCDNFFSENPFEKEVDEAYYATVYADSRTNEWCVSEDDNGYINSVTIGGANSWYMLGHTFWSKEFSETFLEILDFEYPKDETKSKLWEHIFIEHLDVLKMKIRKYPAEMIFEFDTSDDLRKFNASHPLP